MEEPKMTEKKQPKKHIRSGRIVAAVWENAGGHSVTFQRLYKKDGAKNWSYSDSFSPSDLLLLSKVALSVHDELVAVEIRDPEEKPSAESA